MDGVKVLRIGVAPAAYVKRRMIEIARGGKPLPGEPKVWVSSLDSLAKVLTESNMRLLRLIRDSHPQSLSALARQSGRSLSNLSRTLHTLERLGIVAFVEKPDGRKVPTVFCTKVQLVVDFAEARSETA
jgi:predicted transcriptional regulator